jgi:hypothetical protein
LTIRIALILDCDGTLAPDTTSQLLSRVLGDEGRVARFWEETRKLEEAGWDGPLAWIPKLLSAAKAAGEPITLDLLRTVGREIQFHPGVPQIFGSLGARVADLSGRLGIEVTLEVHVLTGGIEDLLEASTLARSVNEICGCLLSYDQQGNAVGPKSIVTFTEKTKFVFALHKGVSKVELRRNPESVNRPMSRSLRPVPFENMIYVGDGPTDVPCFSMISQQGGTAVGIRRKNPPLGIHGTEVLVNYRPRWGPFDPDYSEGGALAELLVDLLNDILVRSERGSPGSHIPHRTV